MGEDKINSCQAKMFDDVVRAIGVAIAGMEKAHGEYWKRSIVKVAPTAGSEFLALKKSVSPTHLLPTDILPDAKSVICFFVPFADEVVASNVAGEMASAQWAKTYIATNELIARISDAVEVVLKLAGFRAGKIPATHNFNTETLMSDWSHRHVAAIADLGSFGINNMLITDSGCCGRLGSIVTNYEFEYVAEEKTGERCLNKIDGTCGACRIKCRFGAYAGEVYDRQKCYQQCLANAEQHEVTGYADVCGKCLVGLPCSLRDPSK